MKGKKPLPSQERLREVFDYSDGSLIVRKNEGRRKAGDKISTHYPYRRIWFDNDSHLVHRLIWAWHFGDPGEQIIDHIDRDPTNSRIENLRLSDHSKNCLNSHALTNTGHRGIQCRDGGVFRVTVQKHHCGTFHTLEEALKVREEMEKKYYA